MTKMQMTKTEDDDLQLLSFFHFEHSNLNFFVSNFEFRVSDFHQEGDIWMSGSKS